MGKFERTSEDYEKEYFIAKKERIAKEWSIRKKIRILTKKLDILRKFKQRNYEYLGAELSLRMKEHDKINTSEVQELFRGSNRLSLDTIKELKGMFTESQSKREKNLKYFISKLRIEYEISINEYEFTTPPNKHTITLGKDQSYSSVYFTSKKQVISDIPKEDEDTYSPMLYNTKDGTQLNAIQHELIHFKDNLISDFYSEDKHPISELKNSILLQNVCTPQILDQVYDNTREMVCMYGILYHNGKLFFEPLTEALATGERDLFYSNDNNCVIQTVRTGHCVSRTDMSSFYKQLDEKTNIYSCYFNREWRDLADL